MPRSEVYQLRLSSAEKAALAHLAAREGLSIARMIRRRFGLSSDPTPVEGVAKLPPPWSDDPVTARQKAAAREAATQGEYEVEVKAGTSVPQPEPRLDPTPPPAEVIATPVASPQPEPPEPSPEEIETEARRIFYAEGTTMMVARRLAKERLSAS